MNNQTESCISCPLNTPEGDTRGNLTICYERNATDAKIQVTICSQQEGMEGQALESTLNLNGINDLIEWLSCVRKEIQDQS